MKRFIAAACGAALVFLSTRVFAGHGGAGAFDDRPNLAAAERSERRAIGLRKSEFRAIRLPTRRIEPAAFGTPAREEGGDRDFFTFSRRNPLKSPDSDE
jgi:hypothetical protein